MPTVHPYCGMVLHGAEAEGFRGRLCVNGLIIAIDQGVPVSTKQLQRHCCHPSAPYQIQPSSPQPSATRCTAISNGVQDSIGTQWAKATRCMRQCQLAWYQYLASEGAVTLSSNKRSPGVTRLTVQVTYQPRTCICNKTCVTFLKDGPRVGTSSSTPPP